MGVRDARAGRRAALPRAPPGGPTACSCGAAGVSGVTPTRPGRRKDTCAMNSNHNPPTVTFISLVAALEDRLQDCIGSEDYVVVIRALVATGDPAAIRELASLLDSTGPIAEESIAGLIAFGEAAIPAMRECVDSLDYEMVRHGHRVLAALGDEASKQWLRDDDVDRMHAYLDRKGFSELAWLFLSSNETDEPNEVA